MFFYFQKIFVSFNDFLFSPFSDRGSFYGREMRKSNQQALLKFLNSI
jgi:hypothetical protein